MKAARASTAALVAVLLSLLLVAGAFAVTPPSVTTNLPSLVSDTSMTINGTLTSKGSDTPSDSNPVSILQKANITSCQLINYGSGNYGCYITFPHQTVAGDTIVVFMWVDLAGTGPINMSDNGGNDWSLTKRYQTGQVSSGGAGYQYAAVISNDTLPMSRVFFTTSSSGGWGSAYELTPSWPFGGEPYPNIPVVCGPSCYTHTIPWFHSNLSLGEIYLWGCPAVVNHGSQVQYYAVSGGCVFDIQNHTGSDIGTTSNQWNSASLLTFEGVGIPTVSVGFLWGTSPSLAGAANVTVDANAPLGPFSKALTGLNQTTQYCYAAWADSATGFTLGSTVCATTASTQDIGIFSQAMNAFWIILFLCVCGFIVAGAWTARAWLGKRHGGGM